MSPSVPHVRQANQGHTKARSIVRGGGRRWRKYKINIILGAVAGHTLHKTGLRVNIRLHAWVNRTASNAMRSLCALLNNREQ